MKVSATSILGLGLAYLVIPGCRLSYEVLSDSDQATLWGDGDASLGGDVGDGDGDGDVSSVGGGGSGDGGGSPGGGNDSGGGNSGGSDSGGSDSGGADSGGSGSGGDPGTGGDASGGAASGGAASGGAASGGSGSGGSASGGSGSGGGGGGDADLIVTTNTDESDVGATAIDPKGTGLSFREALLLANADGGPISIGFDPDLTIGIMADLPIMFASLTITGNNTVLDFSGRVSTNECLNIAAGTSLIEEIELRNCSHQPIMFGGGGGHQVRNSTFIDNAMALSTTQSSTGTTIGPGNYFSGGTTHTVFLGTQDRVVENEFSDVGGAGGSAVFVSGTGDGSTIVGNLIVRARNGVSFNSNGDNAKIWNNTFVSTLSIGIVVGQATGIDVRNNIITHSGLYGLNANSANLSFLDYNLYFSNGSHCNGCASGLGANSKIQDPLYTNFAGEDFTLSSSSAAINSGFDLGEDRNGAGAGNFNGAAPDMGYAEAN